MVLPDSTKPPSSRRGPSLVGRRFVALTVVEELPKHQIWRRYLCRCDCGNEVKVLGKNLLDGNAWRCRPCAVKLNRKHGHAAGHKLSKAYRTWLNMIQRCTNPKNKGFKYYGARGITVCDRWLHSFENFLADMGNPPAGKYSIDRIDNSGNYEPGNCRWATNRQQGLNRRNNRIVTFQGRSQTLTEWCDELGLRYSVIQSRLGNGWLAEDAFMIPVGTRRKQSRAT